MKAKVIVKQRLLLLAFPLLLGACSLIPFYSPPAVETAPAFKEDGDWRPAAIAPTDPESWWTVFGDPVLNDLESRLAIDNQNIKIAEAQYRAARAAVDSARSGLFPTVGADASATRGVSTTGGNVPVTNLYSLTAQASWEVDLWGQVRAGVSAAEAAQEAAQGTLGAARLSAQALLAQTYFQMRAAEAQRGLLAETVEAYGRFLDLTRNRRAAGVASNLDVAQAQTQLNTARTQLADADLQRAQAEHAIAVLVGKPPSAVDLPRSASLAAIPAPPALVPSTTLETRFDIYSAERQVAAANDRIGVARAAYFPVLSLDASGGFKSSRLATLLSAPSRIWAVGPALALTLFDGGARSAAVAQARANFDQAVATYRQTVLTAFQEVEDNLVAQRLLADEAASQEAAVGAAREARVIAENQYRAGTVASLNVITAQASELAAGVSAISIWNRRAAASVQLYKNLAGRKPSASGQ